MPTILICNPADHLVRDAAPYYEAQRTICADILNVAFKASEVVQGPIEPRRSRGVQ